MEECGLQLQDAHCSPEHRCWGNPDLEGSLKTYQGEPTTTEMFQNTLVMMMSSLCTPVEYGMRRLAHTMIDEAVLQSEHDAIMGCINFHRLTAYVGEWYAPKGMHIMDLIIAKDHETFQEFLDTWRLAYRGGNTAESVVLAQSLQGKLFGYPEDMLPTVWPIEGTAPFYKYGLSNTDEEYRVAMQFQCLSTIE